MPELPEVETIVRKLRGAIIGKRVAAVSLSGKALRRPVPGDIAARLRGRTIRMVHRRGKYMILEMEPSAFWLIHLGMSGRLFCSAGPVERVKHTHATIRFDDGWELQYRDPRRFGLMDVAEGKDPSAFSEIRNLGKDPLGPEFEKHWLSLELAKTRRDLKSFLLDQRKIAGLGNIYVCEALYRARLHPARRCNTLTLTDAGVLARSIRAVLAAAIINRGTSFSDFADADGEPGNHQNFLHVFFREGQRCRRCHAVILRMRQSNRSSYFCPGCQVGGPGAIGRKG